MFPLSLIGDASICFDDLPYNFVYTLDQLRDVFFVRFYPVSRKLNYKDKVKNYLELPGESVSSSWADLVHL